jgi:hypothetical protein
MSDPSVPGAGADADADATLVDLPCGERRRLGEFDLGMREFDCPCGDAHAVVMDVHPPERFLPDFLVEVLREAVETTSEEMPEFDTPHLMGIVLEEFPEAVVVRDDSDDGDVGWAMLWVTGFDSRRLHEVIVELVVELMEHAVSHSDDASAVTEFERQMTDFDVVAFVEQYRAERDLEFEDPYA